MPLLEELPNTDQKKGFETQTHQQSNQTPTNQKQSGIMNLIGQRYPEMGLHSNTKQTIIYFTFRQ